MTHQYKHRSFFMILCLTGFALLFNSCCKSKRCKCNDEWGMKVDDCTPKHYGPYYLDSVKPYLWFKPGSWWVYKNSITGETDSIYTVYCDSSFKDVAGTDKKWLTLSYSTVNYKLRSDKYNTDYYYQEQAKYPDVTDFTYSHSLYKTTWFENKTAVPEHCFSYPFNSGSPLFKSFYSSVIIQGTTYTNVAVFESPMDESIQHPKLMPYTLYNYSVSRYYWAKDYGIVKIESDTYRNDNDQPIQNNWELLKSHLIQ